MFEKLYKDPDVVIRFKNGPYAAEREEYLKYCEKIGYCRNILLMYSRETYKIAHKLNIGKKDGLSIEDIERVVKNENRWSHKRFKQVARQWLRYLGCFKERAKKEIPFAGILKDFSVWMEQERGFAVSTIEVWTRYIKEFLCWYGIRNRPIADLKIFDVDSYLASSGDRGWSRVTIANNASALRAFFWFGGLRGLCSDSISKLIESPRLFSHERLPQGPTWEGVKHIFAGMETDDPFDIRDRAILMLFAVYGLRASEVSELQLENIDWEHDRILIPRAKRRLPQIFPLTPTVGNAIAEYLNKVRVRTAHREVFISILAPFRPMSRSALYHVTKKQMLKHGIQSQHKGPHSLRHACASHLICEGFSLKEIGDHLGHHRADSTRIYAKVNLAGLREVAKFDIGGIL